MTMTACGSFLPGHALHNRDLEGFLDTSHEWIFSRTGIAERRIAGPGEDNLTLSLEASRRALRRAGHKGRDVDLVVVATTTADRMVPSLACSLQRELGARGPAFDLNAACSGFIYALAVASRFLETGAARRALVVGTETLSRILDWKDRSTCVLFGDGAGAAILEPCGDGEGIISVCLGADGEGDRLIRAEGGGARMMASLRGNLDGGEAGLREHLPFLARAWEKGDPFLRMDGREVFKFAVRKLEEVVRDLCGRAVVDPREVDLIIPHQANLRIIEAASRRLGVPLERFHLNLERCANTSAASIPLALDDALGLGKIDKGDLVLLVAFGAGLTWAGALMRWTGKAYGKEERY
ncbi:beta-ketoacyl-ACP synthase III [Candidatus Solincola sp.]